MSNDFIRLPILFITLCVLQVFVFNHIHLFGCIMPLTYIYFIAAMAHPYLLDLFISREGEDRFIASMSTLGTKPFVNFVIVLVGGYCTIFYSLEMFNFFNMLQWIECVVGSTILTTALILAVDRLLHRKD